MLKQYLPRNPWSLYFPELRVLLGRNDVTMGKSGSSAELVTHSKIVDKTDILLCAKVEMATHSKFVDTTGISLYTKGFFYLDTCEELAHKGMRGAYVQGDAKALAYKGMRRGLRTRGCEGPCVQGDAKGLAHKMRCWVLENPAGGEDCWAGLVLHPDAAGLVYDCFS